MIEYRPPEVNYIKKMTPIKSTPTQLAHFMKGSQAITLQMSYAYLNQNTAIFSKLRFTKLYCSFLGFSFVFPSKNSSQRLRWHIFIQEILGELSSGHMLTPELFFSVKETKDCRGRKEVSYVILLVSFMKFVHQMEIVQEMETLHKQSKL